MSDYNDIEVEVRDPVGIVRLNRPEKLNAVTYPMLGELRRAIDELSADPAVVGIVITGNGRGFCSGLDSAALMEVTSTKGEVRGGEGPSGDVPGMFTYLLAVPKPVIAAVNGVAAGGGFILAAMSDVRIASTNASFTTTFMKRGLIAEHGSTWVLPRLVGTGRALDLLWTSRRIDAQEAYRVGLVEHLCEPEELLDRAQAYVAEIAASAAPQSIADSKRLLYRAVGIEYPEALREAEPLQWAAIARPDAEEGAKALMEKRQPTFQRLGE